MRGMPTLGALVLLVATSFEATAMDCGEYPVMETRQHDGTRIALVIPSNAMKKAPQWTPGNGEPPLHVSKAVNIALEWAKKRYSRFDSVEIAEISLMGRGCWGNEGHWYYQFDFTPVMDGNHLWGTGYFAAVLMDGTVIEPTKSE